jgi:hypothetical protein
MNAFPIAAHLVLGNPAGCVPEWVLAQLPKPGWRHGGSDGRSNPALSDGCQLQVEVGGCHRRVADPGLDSHHVGPPN